MKSCVFYKKNLINSIFLITLVQARCTRKNLKTCWVGGRFVLFVYLLRIIILCFISGILNFQLETRGVLRILKVVAQRSKVYYLKTRNIKDGKIGKINKLKGIPHLVQNLLTLEDYKDAVFSNTVKYVDYSKIQSKKHKLSTVRVKTRCMTGFDDKVIIY